MATTDDNRTLAPLVRRPEARAFKIEELLAEVRLGRVRIPPFQRRLRWVREDAVKLIDSLYRGYPVGTLLFWETTSSPGEIHFGSVTVDSGARTDALWVVDGQQRIVSLVRMLLASAPDTDEFALYFDLDSAQGEFVPPPTQNKRQEDPSRWLPLTEVLDSEHLFQWLLEKAPSSKERRERAVLLGKRVREYDIPAYVVRTDSEEILREIFGRINSSGKRLEASEVFDALHGAHAHSKPATIPEIVTDLTALGFGRVEEKILYRLLRVLQGKDVAEREEEGPLRLSKETADLAYRHTAATAALVIQFLKHDAQIPHYELLPYKQPLVTLGKFFQHYPSPTPRSRDLLVRWVWRGALNGAHRGDTVSTRNTLERIVANNEDQSVQMMLETVSKSPETPLDAAAKFNFRFASSKLLTLALLDLGPRDLESGASLDLEPLNAATGPSMFLPQLITTHGNHGGLILTVANRLAHPRRTGIRRSLLNVTDPAILASHGITAEAIDALCKVDTTAFLSLRLDHLRPHFRQFFDRHARWDEPDRPSLSSLFVVDEGA